MSNRRPKSTAKPPMPANLEAEAAKAIKRHAQRHVSPGVAVQVEKAASVTFAVSSPHRDVAAWQAMICDALGTRSVSTAQTFLYQLTELCSENWLPSEVEGECGEWCPDEQHLNMILNMVAGIKPRNELEAAQAAQMVAVHLMTMRLSARALRNGSVCAEDAAVAGKLARTFVMQTEALAKLKGKRSSSKQTITVKQVKHVHNHQHVHLEGERAKNEGQPHERDEPRTDRQRPGSALPGSDAAGNVLPMRRDEGSITLPQARGSKRVGGSDG